MADGETEDERDREMADVKCKCISVLSLPAVYLHTYYFDFYYGLRTSLQRPCTKSSMTARAQ